MNFKNLFGLSSKKANIDVNNINNSKVNILNFQSDSESINKFIESFLENNESGVSNFHKQSNELILKNDSTLLQAKNITFRIETVQKIIDEWGDKSWLNIYGGFDTGKSQLSLLLKNQLKFKCIWISLKGLTDSEFRQKILYLVTSVLSKNITSKEGVNIDNKQLIIFDDLPQLGNNDQINTLLIQLINYCTQNNIKILSTSNYKLHSKIKNVINSDFTEINIPLLTKDETLEVLKTYTNTKKNLKYLDSIYTVSQGYPIYVQVICKYLEDKNWSLDVDEFFKFLTGEAFNNLSDETYQKLLSTTEDESARELLYRLNIVSGDISNDIIKLVCKASPIINKPIEKIIKLTGTWLQKNENNTYTMSPLIRRLGKENLASTTVIEVNNSLGKFILAKESKSQYDVQSAMLYLVNGESYDEAGMVFISVLQFYITKTNLLKESGLDIFWSSTPLPTGMSTTLKILIRTLQLYIESDLKTTNSINYKEDKRDYLRNDLESLIKLESDLEEPQILFSKLILFKSYLLENGKKAMSHFSIFTSSNRFLNEIEDNYLKEGFTNNIWLLLYDLESYDDVKTWFYNYRLINKPIEEYDYKSVELFSKILCDNLIAKNTNSDEAIRILDFIYENSQSNNLEILGAFSSRAKITILCEKLDNIIEAEQYMSKVYPTFQNELALFLIKDELGRQQYYLDKKDDSLKTLLEVVEIDISYITKIDAYLTIAKIVGEKDTALAHQYTDKAINYGRSKVELTKLSKIKLKGEYATSQWFIGNSKEAIYTLSNAYSELLESYNSIDRFDDINDYNITVLRIGSVLNYIFQVVENGIPPEKIFDGSEYAPPSRGMFNSTYDAKLLNDYYYEERKYLVVFVFIRAFEYFNDIDNSVKWANVAFNLNNEIKLYTFKNTIKSFIPYQILQDKYQETLNIEDDLITFGKIPREDLEQEITNPQQKKMFLEILKKETTYDYSDDYLLTFNVILILLRKFRLLVEGNMTKKVLVESTKEYLNINSSYFKEQEAINSVHYILENFPNSYEKSKELIEWINKLEIENIKPIQIICYLICSLTAPPVESLKLQFALMPYLQKVVKGISRGAYQYILYPFVYEFWTNWVYLEPEIFHFTELWDENLKRSINVENKYKVIALYALVSMHLGYKPKENEQEWMQDYIDEVIKNKKS